MNNIFYINKFVEEKVKDMFNFYFWMPDLLNRQGDEYNDSLNAFHYIFSLGEDGKTYLWNKYITINSPLSDFYESDFTNDELEFFKSIKEAKQDAINKYGSLSKDVNINKPIETNRLILKAFNEETSKLYDEYFYQNKDEFENYYSLDYGDSFKYCHMNERPLGFAIFLKNSNIPIGSICFTNFDNDALYNVEYFVKKEYRRNGYAFEALIELINQLKLDSLFVLSETLRECVFDVVNPDIRCLKIKTEITNTSSQKLAEKAGFTRYGTLLFSGLYKNKYYDEVVYYLVLNEDRKGNLN